MYLPTFWKLTAEATAYRARHMSGYVVPVTVLCIHTPSLMLFSLLDHVPITI
jgi:hypothetical protein